MAYYQGAADAFARKYSVVIKAPLAPSRDPFDSDYLGLDRVPSAFAVPVARPVSPGRQHRAGEGVSGGVRTSRGEGDALPTRAALHARSRSRAASNADSVGADSESHEGSVGAGSDTDGGSGRPGLARRLRRERSQSPTPAVMRAPFVPVDNYTSAATTNSADVAATAHTDGFEHALKHGVATLLAADPAAVTVGDRLGKQLKMMWPQGTPGMAGASAEQRTAKVPSNVNDFAAVVRDKWLTFVRLGVMEGLRGLKESTHVLFTEAAGQDYDTRAMLSEPAAQGSLRSIVDKMTSSTRDNSSTAKLMAHVEGSLLDYERTTLAPELNAVGEKAVAEALAAMRWFASKSESIVIDDYQKKAKYMKLHFTKEVQRVRHALESQLAEATRKGNVVADALTAAQAELEALRTAAYCATEEEHTVRMMEVGAATGSNFVKEVSVKYNEALASVQPLNAEIEALRRRLADSRAEMNAMRAKVTDATADVARAEADAAESLKQMQEAFDKQTEAMEADWAEKDVAWQAQVDDAHGITAKVQKDVKRQARVIAQLKKTHREETKDKDREITALLAEIELLRSGVGAGAGLAAASQGQAMGDALHRGSSQGGDAQGSGRGDGGDAAQSLQSDGGHGSALSQGATGSGGASGDGRGGGAGGTSRSMSPAPRPSSRASSDGGDGEPELQRRRHHGPEASSTRVTSPSSGQGSLRPGSVFNSGSPAGAGLVGVSGKQMFSWEGRHTDDVRMKGCTCGADGAAKAARAQEEAKVKNASPAVAAVRRKSRAEARVVHDKWCPMFTGVPLQPTATAGDGGTHGTPIPKVGNGTDVEAGATGPSRGGFKPMYRLHTAGGSSASSLFLWRVSLAMHSMVSAGDATTRARSRARPRGNRPQSQYGRKDPGHPSAAHMSTLDAPGDASAAATPHMLRAPTMRVGGGFNGAATARAASRVQGRPHSAGAPPHPNMVHSGASRSFSDAGLLGQTGSSTTATVAGGFDMGDSYAFRDDDGMTADAVAASQLALPFAGDDDPANALAGRTNARGEPVDVSADIRRDPLRPVLRDPTIVQGDRMALGGTAEPTQAGYLALAPQHGGSGVNAGGSDAQAGFDGGPGPGIRDGNSSGGVGGVGGPTTSVRLRVPAAVTATPLHRGVKGATRHGYGHHSDGIVMDANTGPHQGLHGSGSDSDLESVMRDLNASGSLSSQRRRGVGSTPPSSSSSSSSSSRVASAARSRRGSPLQRRRPNTAGPLRGSGSTAARARASGGARVLPRRTLSASGTRDAAPRTADMHSTGTSDNGSYSGEMPPRGPRPQSRSQTRLIPPGGGPAPAKPQPTMVHNAFAPSPPSRMTSVGRLSGVSEWDAQQAELASHGTPAPARHVAFASAKAVHSAADKAFARAR